MTRLVRDTINGNYGKYALIRLDKLPAMYVQQIVQQVKDYWNPATTAVAAVLRTEIRTHAIEIGGKGDLEEFFVLKLKDVNTAKALNAYAQSVSNVDPELAQDIREMAQRAKDRQDRRQPTTNMQG